MKKHKCDICFREVDNPWTTSRGVWTGHKQCLIENIKFLVNPDVANEARFIKRLEKHDGDKH